jgi:carboxymethylenebutenolidase
MCDDITEAENEVFLKSVGLTRREVSVSAGASVALMWVGCKSSPKASERAAPTEKVATSAAAATEGAAEVASRAVTVPTKDGTAEAFFVAPKGGAHPGVIMWPDVAGLRPAYETMATRLAGAGYAVLAVNPYYRSSKLPILREFAEWRTPEGREKIAPMRAALTPDAIAADGASFVAWLDEQPEVDKARKIGAMGYCMSGSFTFRVAAAAPERVGALASFHGGGLVTDEPSSPHLLLSKVKAAALVCIAQNDDEREPEAKVALKDAAAAAGVTAEIEVYPAQHGWCTIDSPVYDEVQAERAWSRMLATFKGRL